jgi:hypothetical protein
MGGANGRVRSAPDTLRGGNQANFTTDPRNFYDLAIIPSKSVFQPGVEDIAGQVILDLRRPFARPGIIVISFDGKESFEYAPFANSG